MRAGIGLIGLLVGVAVMLWLFSVIELPKARVGKQVQTQARQMSGRGEDEISAMDSFKVDPAFSGSKFTGLIVTDVTRGGAMHSYFGLARGDRITALDGMRLNDLANGDDELAHALVAEAFQRRQKLTIVRNGQTFIVPAPPGSLPRPAPAAPAAGAAAVPGQAPAQAPDPTVGQAPAEQPAGTPADRPSDLPPLDDTSALDRQLQGIQDAAGAAGRDPE